MSCKGIFRHMKFSSLNNQPELPMEIEYIFDPNSFEQFRNLLLFTYSLFFFNFYFNLFFKQIFN